ncbi:LANO_0H02146g1_1 [Lachancea nothofagi CBS 11611]|uniref:LANO_0H02146g1_1 n=1 Tax=Lachancea nothofagi CBS 11611 TaxID=1266666 RepID=A0A1G4KL28_9SACH|nr:LANO_0H02146g1_1 [Lachancea nothofagi CBS 11611]
MSLIVYGDTISDETTRSVVLQDPGSRSLVVMNPESGEISLLRQIRGPQSGYRSKRATNLISSYFCPQCGSEIGTGFEFTSARSKTGSDAAPFVHKNYFKLLEQNTTNRVQQPRLQGVPIIPSNLFTPGYYRRFFQELCLLGSGARGSVFKVEHILMDNHLGVYALKKIHIGNDLSWLELGMKEVKFLSALTHSSVNLITYNHVWLEMDSTGGIVRARNGKDTGVPEQIPCIFILQKFCPGGNLEEVVLKSVFERFTDHESPEERKRRFKLKKAEKMSSPKQRGLNTQQILSIISDIASGLKELHGMNIIHRDLKPSNCLLSEKFDMEKEVYGDKCFPTVIISDFGESQICGQLRSATGATGTLEFTAPEVIIMNSEEKGLKLPQFTFQSDMYSLGMVCYFLVFGELPFANQESLSDLKRDIMSFTINTHLLLERHKKLNLRPVNPEIFEMIVKLLNANPDTRPTALDVKSEISRMMAKTSVPGMQPLAQPSDVLVDEELDSESEELDKIPYRKLQLRILIGLFWHTCNITVAAFAAYRYNHISYLPYVCFILLGLSLRSECQMRKFYLIAMLTSLFLMYLSTMHLSKMQEYQFL